MSRNIHRMPSVLPGDSRQYRERPKRNFRPLGIFLFLIGSVGVLYWFVFMSVYFAVQKVEITGTTNDAVAAVGNQLVGENIFQIDADTVEQNMQRAFPSVATVTLIRGLPHVIRITVTLRQPKLRWYSHDKAYILDESGEIFSEGDQPNYASLPKIQDSSGQPVQLGQQVVLPSFIQFVNEVGREVPQLFGRSIAGNEINETTYYLDILLDNGLRIRLTTQRPSKEQIEAALAILTAHPEAKLIDVRVPTRGYWK